MASCDLRDMTCRGLIDGLQSLRANSNDKDVAVMLVELTVEANEGS